MTAPPAFEWLYLKNGKVAHAISTFNGRSFSAECGMYTFGFWRGTGSQAEYDKAASLPKCKSCLKHGGVR